MRPALCKNRVETVVLLSKGDVESQKLRVEFSLEDMDTDGFERGATYNDCPKIRRKLANDEKLI